MRVFVCLFVFWGIKASACVCFYAMHVSRSVFVYTNVAATRRSMR
jgi:hypothetical protein